MLHDRHEGLQRIAPFSLAEALARHVLTTAEDGKYLSEPLLHCDLLVAAGRPEAVVVVLTGMRLLTVDNSSWCVQLNVPLRKLHAATYTPHVVAQDGAAHVLQLQLTPRRAGGSGAAAAPVEAAVRSEMRRIVCHTEEAAVALHEHIIEALDALRARRGIWHLRRGGPTRRGAAGGDGSRRPSLPELPLELLEMGSS